MSNRGRTDNFDFDDDPFGDNQNKAFDNFDDDFGDDNLDNLDDLSGLDDLDSGGDDGFPPDDGFTNGTEERGGPNRTFVLLGVLLFLTFLLGIGTIIFLALRPPVSGPFELTSTAVAIINSTRIAEITETAVQRVQAEFQTQTATQQVQFTQTADAGTAIALNAFATQTAEQVLLFGQQTETALAAVPTETPTPEISPTLDPIAQTSQALTQVAAEQTSAAETQAILALTPTDGVIGQIDATSVLLTATELARQLLPTTPGTEVALTPDGTRVFATPRPGELPDTGLFDGVASGDGFGVIMLMAFGLVGLIVISRRARAGINKR